jgi:hypothetical protein
MNMRICCMHILINCIYCIYILINITYIRVVSVVDHPNYTKEVLINVCTKQWRIQGRHQPALGYPLDSLKNKGRMIKNKISYDPNILFI